MKKQSRKEAAESRLCFHETREHGCVENSKRRHMLSMIGGNFRFIEKILTIRKIQEPTFFSKASARNH